MDDRRTGQKLLFPTVLDRFEIIGPNEQLYARYREPDKKPVVRLDPEAASTHPSVPSYAVPSVWLGLRSDRIKIGEAKLVLSDFGVAFCPDEKFQFVLHALAVLLPRDSQFQSEAPLTFTLDTWSLGCVIFELLGHRTLFDGYCMTNENYITAQQIGLQWAMPPVWWSRWKAPSKYINEEDKGTKMADGYENWPWELQFEE
ncbi:hypothetical protein E4U17_004221 [Claviceps sp. LM77 group G4]|nr:hypothetical protein E4U17_004221 [Claviceps sp. LM77 group G4]KAG6070310.1 hypothetical protein E4U33_004257 [Claviceps sp. LM78 group G4]KAG6083698.1 hypothetical protein E4U16_003564 [Claviceps sp. LM84 group G4]